MSNLILHDRNHSEDNAIIKGTRILIKDPATGKVIFEGHNKVVCPGGIFTAAKHFNLDISGLDRPTSYNNDIPLDNKNTTNTNKVPERVALFAVGTDGCGTSNSDVKAVMYKDRIVPTSLVPFKYSTTDHGTNIDHKYYGKRTISGDTTVYAYYFKTFESEPKLVWTYSDGTPISSDTFYGSSNSNDAQVYIELNLKIIKDDCRDYFINGEGINNARINTISLLTAWPVLDSNGDVSDYCDIRPLTKLNIPNEALSDTSKGLDITYDIFY